MSSSRLHILLMSNLAKDQGGRETWLQYFTESVLADYSEVHVYGSTVRRERTGLPAGVVVHSHAGTSRISFVIWALRSMKRHSSNHDVFIYCGVPLESAIGYLFSFIRSQAIHIVWARSRGVAEIRGAIAGRTVTRSQRAMLSIMEAMERLALGRLRVLFNGTDTLEHFQTRYRIRHAPLVIPNAVPAMSDATPPPPGAPPTKPFRVGYVGRLVATKGYPDFLDLASALPASDYSFEAWGPNIGGYEESPDVTYHGTAPREDISAILRTLDAVVFLNRTAGGQAAGVSHGILEAMHCGCVIVAWDNPTHAQLLNPGNALLIEEGNLVGLRACVGEAAALSPDARAALQRMAQMGAEPFSVEAHVRSYREFVKRLLD